MTNRARVKGAGAAGGMFAVLLTCSFSASFGQSMMNIALPEVAERFSITLSMANWLIVGYTVVAAMTIMLAAFLLKRLGLRRLFFVGCGALALGSGLAALAPSFPLLLGCRLLQAVCTGLFYPTVTGVIMATSPRGSVGVHLALNSGVIAVGLATAPVVSGLVLTYLGFRAMFVVPFVLATALLIVCAFRLRDIGARDRASVDFASVVLGFVGLGALVLGLSEITHALVPSLVALAAGTLALALFAWRQLAVKEPLLNLRPLKHPRFALGLVLVMMGMMVSFSLSVLLPLYFEGALAATSFAAGLLLLGPVLVNAALSFVGGRLYDKRGMGLLVPLGFALAIAGQAGVLFLSEHVLMGWVVLAAAVAYAGLGFVVPPSKAAALGQLPAELYAHGAAINSTFVQIASAVGTSLFVGVLSSDVLAETAAGLARSEAYAVGFAHTLVIAIVIAAGGLVLALLYARSLRPRPRSRADARPPR